VGRQLSEPLFVGGIAAPPVDTADLRPRVDFQMTGIMFIGARPSIIQNNFSIKTTYFSNN